MRVVIVRVVGFVVVALNLIAAPLTAAEYGPILREPTLPSKLLWGDTHLHTRLSGDAYMTGATAFSPEDAYRFARGETVLSTSGVPAALRSPLDFLVVSDHSEFIGLFAATEDRDPAFLQTALGQRWREFMDAGDIQSMFIDFQRMIYGDDPDRSTADTKLDMWRRVARTADRFNAPGDFTALIGYEWSSTPNNSNLHRNVIFRDDANTVASLAPFTAVDSKNPEDLWRHMTRYERETGGQVLAIPHNGNLSNGLMFSESNFDGQPLTKELAALRARWEPIVEVTQIKGDGEAHPTLSPDDAFADYETWDAGNFPAREGATPKQDWMLPYEYARSALKVGLKLERGLGVNPYQFGMIGSTDAHTGLAAVEEDNFFGKFVESEPNTERASSNMAWLGWPNAILASSGLAAVWATENTREAIFDAMRRREVYATTGPRIGLRFFASWSFEAGDEQQSNAVSKAYEQGVPMGGELRPAAQDQAPTFMLIASRDPEGAALERAQIVKGWLDQDGQLQERVFDVAVSNGRAIDAGTQRVAPLAAENVDLETASYSNAAGAAELRVIWQDPTYEQHVPAFYYARVLQVPTPRWPAYDRAYLGSAVREDAALVTQDRAYSSPIWVTANSN